VMVNTAAGVMRALRWCAGVTAAGVMVCFAAGVMVCIAAGVMVCIAAGVMVCIAAGHQISTLTQMQMRN